MLENKVLTVLILPLLREKDIFIFFIRSMYNIIKETMFAATLEMEIPIISKWNI